jgi:acylphosphatase
VTEARRMVITGRVQGVGFRAFVVEAARGLGLGGWVRNRRDGSVELHAEGEAAALEALRAACGRGPLLARVDRVVEEPAAAEGHRGFRQAADA